MAWAISIGDSPKGTINHNQSFEIIKPLQATRIGVDNNKTKQPKVNLDLLTVNIPYLT